MSGAGTLARNQSAEERYLAKLESARSTWWSSGNFDTWKRLYAGEYPRGFLIMDTLRKYVPEFRVQGAHVLVASIRFPCGMRCPTICAVPHRPV